MSTGWGGGPERERGGEKREREAGPAHPPVAASAERILEEAGPGGVACRARTPTCHQCPALPPALCL